MRQKYTAFQQVIHRIPIHGLHFPVMMVKV